MTASAVVDAPLGLSWLEAHIWQACDVPRSLTELSTLIEAGAPGYRTTPSSLSRTANELCRRGHLVNTNPTENRARRWLQAS